MHNGIDYNKIELLMPVAAATNLGTLITSEIRLFGKSVEYKTFDYETKRKTAFLICKTIVRLSESFKDINCPVLDCSADNTLPLWRMPGLVDVNIDSCRLVRSTRLQPINLLNVSCYDVLDKFASCYYIDNYIDSYIKNICSLINKEIKIIEMSLNEKIGGVMFDRLITPSITTSTSNTNIFNHTYTLTNRHYFLDSKLEFIKLK